MHRNIILSHPLLHCDHSKQFTYFSQLQINVSAAVEVKSEDNPDKWEGPLWALSYIITLDLAL